MRRKRSRLKLRPKPFVWIALACVFLSGVFFSPATSLRKVRIEGAQPADREALEAIVGSLRGRPALQVNAKEVESRALQLPAIRTAEFSRNVFGSALLRLTYRRPVARLYGSPNVALSDDGVLYPSEALPESLPQVQLPKGGPPTLLSVAGNWQPLKMAKLAQDARSFSKSGVIRIQVDPRGVVWLNVDSGRVILGSLDDLDKKLRVLRERMATYPNELSEVEALNLTQPDNPSLLRRKVNRRS